LLATQKDSPPHEKAPVPSQKGSQKNRQKMKRLSQKHKGKKHKKWKQS
jgi:hypothetical protein